MILLILSSSLKRIDQSDIVRVFDIARIWETTRKSGELYGRILYIFFNIKIGGLSFNIWVGGYDNFFESLCGIDTLKEFFEV